MEVCIKTEGVGELQPPTVWNGTGYIDAKRRLFILNDQYVSLEGCVAGYDIECHSDGGLPLPSAPITVLSLWCSCGYKWHELIN